MSKDAWKRFVERDAVLAENAPPSPVWNRNVPRCHEACPYHDGKRCELIGIRAPETCEPVAEALGNLVEERWEKMRPPEPPGSTLAPSSPWRPIEDYLSLTPGEYMVRMKRGELAEHITIARWTGAEWRVRIADVVYDYRAEHITHLHEMGPIRGPGETT